MNLSDAASSWLLGRRLRRIDEIDHNEHRPRDERRHGNGENPCPNHLARHTPAHGRESLNRTNTNDGPHDGVGCADGNAQPCGQEQRNGGCRLGARPAIRAQLGDLHSHGFHDTPATGHCSQGNRQATDDHDPHREFHPMRLKGCLLAPPDRRVEQGRDDPHGFLGVVPAVSEAISSASDQLDNSEALFHLGRCVLAPQPHHRRDKNPSQHHSDQRCDNDECHSHQQFVQLDDVVELPGENDRSPSEPTKQGMGRTGRQSKAPGDQIPDNGAQQSRQNDFGGNIGCIYPLGDRVGDVNPKEPRRREVPPGSPYDRYGRGQDPRGHDRGDGIGRIVEAIDEIKRESNENNESNVGFAKDVQQIMPHSLRHLPSPYEPRASNPSDPGFFKKAFVGCSVGGSPTHLSARFDRSLFLKRAFALWRGFESRNFHLQLIPHVAPESSVLTSGRSRMVSVVLLCVGSQDNLNSRIRHS